MGDLLLAVLFTNLVDKMMNEQTSFVK